MAKRKSVPKKTAELVQPAGDFDDDFDIPELPGDDEVVRLSVSEKEDTFSYDTAFRMGFVGVGQAGSRIAQTFYNMGYRRVCVIDGAVQDLEDVHEDIPRLDLGTGGAGKDIEYGAAAVVGKEENIRELISESLGGKCDCILVCASLGGGTGSGASPAILDIVKALMLDNGSPARAGCILALPMRGEGQRFARNALVTFQRIRIAGCAPLIIIDNQRIQELFPVGITKIYDQCNSQIAKLFHLFNQLAAQRSRFVTFDRTELASLLDKGIVTFGAGKITNFTSANSVGESIRNQLSRTVLAPVDLRTAAEAGCIFSASEAVLDSVPMDFLDGGFDMLTRLLREGATVHRGIYKGSSPDLRCFTLLAGLDAPADRLKELGEQAKIPSSKLAEYLGVDD
jgi:cell division GTPase FtsZ